MINKLVFVWDFLYHNPMCDGTYHYYAVDLFKSQIKLATDLEIVELRTLKNSKGEEFSRQKFYDLSNYSPIENSYFSYDINKIQQPSFEYLKTFLDENTFVFGFEMGLELRQILTDFNINFVNFWYHSWKLFDDAFLMINTNNKEIYDKLQQYRVQNEKFEFYAKYWTYFTKQKGELDYLNNLENNSCLFVGQTLRDKSTDKNGVMLNILHFKSKLEELAKQYSKIYYIPHPLVQYNEEIERYIKDTSYIEKLENVNTYHLLMSEKIKKVVGISSSVLYEAQFFNKNIEYFYKPLFKIDDEFSLETFISVFEDYYNPHFWADVLSVVMSVDMSVENKIWFEDISNKFRNINHIYYGYQNLNENYRLKKEIERNYNSSLVAHENNNKEVFKQCFDSITNLYEIFNIFSNKHKINILYNQYRILSNITFGKAKSQYLNKKRFYKNELNKIQNIKR